MQMQNKRKTKTKQNEETNDRIMNIDNTDILINNLGVKIIAAPSSAYLIFLVNISVLWFLWLFCCCLVGWLVGGG